MTVMLAAALALALAIGIVAIALWELFRRRAFLGAGLVGLAAVIAGLGLGVVGWNRYHDGLAGFTSGETQITVSSERVGNQQYLLHLRSGEEHRVVAVDGDEWRLDVMTVDWPLLQPRYRVRLLRTRYTDIHQGLKHPPTREPLDAGETRALQPLQRAGEWLPFLTIAQNTTPYEPLDPSETYLVHIDADGQPQVRTTQTDR